MSNSSMTPGIAAGRLDAAALADNFDDLHAPFEPHEAAVASDRCYFCYDAPCVTACPTDIDIPLFIRQIATGTSEAAAKTIFEQNILGGMCARVCPTETLCEEACVREAAEGKPVEIGRLQRHATDTLMAQSIHPFTRAPSTGKKIAVLGAGPAGLSAAHRLAMHGHVVDLFDPRGKAGGLNEFGIAAYKSTDDFAQSEVEWLMKIGGITAHLSKAPQMEALKSEYDAIFLGVGLGGVNSLRAAGEERDGVSDAVSFISDLRQASDLAKVPVGRHVVVIGGGMTAVDAAVQSKLLGAETVTIAYRRDQSAMPASRYEQYLATSKGVRIIQNAMPKAIHDGEIELEYSANDNGKLKGTGETFRIKADQVFKAIGQTLEDAQGLTTEHGKIKVSDTGQTSDPMVWAGGDCATGGDDLTVTAVAEGRDAAEHIHETLTT